MTAALEMQRTRPTRIKVAGIQTYPLTWVPTGHSEHSHSGRRGRELPVSKLIHPEDTPPALPQPEGPSGAESSRGYENAASLVFLPCFSPADSQNRLAVSEGRGVLEENKRILPPILSRGVALPSQMWQFGQTESNAFTRALFSQRRPAGGGHTIVVPDRSVPRLSPPDSGTLPRLHGLYNLPPPVACTWREDTVEGEGPQRGKRLPTE